MGVQVENRADVAKMVEGFEACGFKTLYGRIVVGIRVPLHEMEQWQAFLDTLRLSYRYWNENKNPADKLFLG